MSEKQDRTGARTAADIEMKYNHNKSFAEVAGIAADARTTAESAKKAVIKLDESLDAEEVFNRLTNNGELQGLYRDEDGNLFVNATYIKSIEELFAKDLTMTGTFTNEVEVFLEPGEEEIETIRQHLLGINVLPAELQPLYDSNGDGQITLSDLANFRMAQMGEISLKNQAFAKKTKLTLTINLKNPEKFIEYTGKNMWSRDVSGYIGIYTASLIEKEKSRLKKTLYTGSWSTGTITVPNTDNYMLFKISMLGQGTPILAARHGDYVRGIGGYSSATPTVTTYQFGAEVSGESWELVACNSIKPLTTNAPSPQTVTAIVGII